MDGNDIRKIFGSSVQDLRKAKGYSQEKLAELLSVDKNTINRIETGINFVTSDTLAKLSDVLDVHPTMFFAKNPSINLNKNGDLRKPINKLLQTLTPEKLEQAYNILRVL